MRVKGMLEDSNNSHKLDKGNKDREIREGTGSKINNRLILLVLQAPKYLDRGTVEEDNKEVTNLIFNSNKYSNMHNRCQMIKSLLMLHLHLKWLKTK